MGVKLNHELRRRISNDVQTFVEELIRKYLPNEVNPDTHTVNLDRPILLKRDNYKYAFAKVMHRLFRMDLDMAQPPVSMGIGQYLGKTIYYYTYIDRSGNYKKGWKYEKDVFIDDKLFDLKYPDRCDSVIVTCRDKDYKELTMK